MQYNDVSGAPYAFLWLLLTEGKLFRMWYKLLLSMRSRGQGGLGSLECSKRSMLQILPSYAPRAKLLPWQSK